MRSLALALVAAAILLGLPMGTPSVAIAADPRTEADALFRAAQKLMDQGLYAEACGKFADSQRLDPALGTQLNLARCRELEGKTATAWALYREVADIATRAGQRERAATAADLAGKLEPALSRLRIDAPALPAGAVVERDGAPVAAASLGTAEPVDPGEYVVGVAAPGYEPWRTKVSVPKGGGSTVTVTVPTLARKAPAGAAPAPPPAAPAAAAPAAAPAAVPEGPGARRTAGFVLGGVGVAAVGVGAVFGVMTLSDASSAASDPALCPDNHCTPEGRAAIDAAETKGWVSTIGIGAGVAALAAGVVLVLTSPRASGAPAKGSSAAPRAAVLPSLGPGEAGLVVRSSF